MPSGTEVGLGLGHIVLDGDPAPPKRGRIVSDGDPATQGGIDPQLSDYVCCDQTAVWVKMPLSTEVVLGPGDIVLDGDPASLHPKGHSPQFSAHVCCGQTAGWIKMPLGTEVGLDPGDIVLDGERSSPTERGTAAPSFSPCLLWANGRPSQLLLSTSYHLTFLDFVTCQRPTGPLTDLLNK